MHLACMCLVLHREALRLHSWTHTYMLASYIYISASHSPAQATSLDELDAIDGVGPDEPPPLEPLAQPTQVLRGTPLHEPPPPPIPAPWRGPAFAIPEPPTPNENRDIGRDLFATYRFRLLASRAPPGNYNMPPPPTSIGRASGPPPALPIGRPSGPPPATPMARWASTDLFRFSRMPHTPALSEETSESGVLATETPDAEMGDDEFPSPDPVSPMRMDFERLASRAIPDTGPPPDWRNPQGDGPPRAPVNSQWPPPFNPWAPNGPLPRDRRIPRWQPLATDRAQFGGPSMLEQAMTAVWGISRMHRVGRSLDETLYTMNDDELLSHNAAYIRFLRHDVMRTNNDMALVIETVNEALQDVVIHVACAYHQTTCAKAR
jgi:hypothetical protein